MPSRPEIVIGDKNYQWDPDEKEYYYMDGDNREYVTSGDLMEAIEDAEEDATITIDGKEYFYNSDLDEWFVVGDDDEEEYVPSGDVEDALGGSNTMDPVS